MLRLTPRVILKLILLALVGVLLAPPLQQAVVDNLWSLPYAQLTLTAPEVVYTQLPPPPAGHSQHDLWEAKRALAAGEVDVAYAPLATLATSGNAEALTLWGDFLWDAGERSAAVEVWLEGYDWLSLEQAGQTARAEEDLDLAHQAYTAIITLDPGNRRAQAQLGAILLAQQSYAEAVERLESANVMGINLPWQMDQAKAAREAGDLPQAISLYQTIIEAAPDFGPAYYEMAWIYYLADQPQEAAAAIEQALMWLPAPGPAHYVRAGRIYELAGQPEEARASYEQVLLLDPDNPFAQRRLTVLNKQLPPPAQEQAPAPSKAPGALEVK